MLARIAQGMKDGMLGIQEPRGEVLKRVHVHDIFVCARFSLIDVRQLIFSLRVPLL
jgi:hypothetical protein